MTPAAQRWLRFLALTGGLVMTAYVASYLVLRRTPSKPLPEVRRDLTPDIEVVSNDFQYLHKEGDVTRLLLRAKRDTAYVSGRHKLEGIELQIFDARGQATGKLTADACDYDPTARVAEFKGRVVIATTQGLTIETETVRYDREAETAATSDPVRFARGRVSGEAVGVHFDGKTDRLTLEQAVRVTVAPEKSNRPTTVITAGRGEYTAQDQRIVLSGGAKIVHGGDMLSARTMAAQLDDAQRLRRVEAHTAATLHSSEADSILTAQTLTFDFDSSGGLTRAVGLGQAVLRRQAEGERWEVSGDRLEADFRRGANSSEITTAQATGGARLHVEPVGAASAVSPEQKTLRAHTLRAAFAPGGRVLQTAVAEGEAMLTVTPAAATHGERKTLRAPRFDAAFYPDGKVQTCVASGGVEALVEPASSGEQRRPRKTTSERAEADFDAVSGELTRLVQTGNVVFEDGLRQARAERATLIRAREVIELRGERRRPVVWDDTARVEARELDLSTAGRRHAARGEVRTTYYDARRTGNAGVFGRPDAPVFITAREAHAELGRAVFIGDARCWQGDSFVRGDRLELFQADRRLTAMGNVATAFYRAGRPAAGSSGLASSSDALMFGTAGMFTYSDVERRARYAENVKLVQGDATLTAETVEAELAARESRLERLMATGKVVIVQPGRQATGDAARYTAADDRYVITGNLARVEDAVRGVCIAPELSFVKAEGVVRALSSGNAQRVRTTYRLKP
ncbi:MAG: LPS export ABC transporter periplasmic protein LptC [Chloracidobacterium sp.]|nr:LPS export ABC transporter periplasmic protein LptC [Chloracidobacterium sp.]MDW8217456.1 LPS export ABC transporter periplasmic protein LptC [Acidobacteriota bacterium]